MINVIFVTETKEYPSRVQILPVIGGKIILKEGYDNTKYTVKDIEHQINIAGENIGGHDIKIYLIKHRGL